MISTSEREIMEMKMAEENGEVIVLSDWSHFTSERYMEALRETGYDIL